MALTAGQVESVQLYSGVESQVVDMQEGASATTASWYKGDIIVTTSGLVTGVGASGAFTGIATAQATAVDYAKLGIALVDLSAIYLMRMATTTNSARANIGEAFGLSWTAGIQRIDTSATTAGSVDVYLVGIYPEDIGVASAGVDEGRVLVRFVHDVLAGVSGA